MGEATRTVVPPGGHFGALMGLGDRLRIVDIEGQQVTDLVSVSSTEKGERLGMYPSRAVNRTWKLTRGHTLYSNRARPMWLIEEDTVGENYSGGGFCNAAINHVRYGAAGTPNCLDNLLAALRPYGFAAEDIDFDACLNIFMTVRYEPDGRWEIGVPKSKAGDHMVLRSLMGQVVAVSNCPQVLNPVNAGRLKPVAIDLIRA